MKCILLVRVSTESQSYDEQQKELYELADRYGYKESDIVSVAEKESGIKLDEEERAGLNKMKELIETGEFDCVFAWEISRIARRKKILFSILEYLVGLKIQLVIKEPHIELLKGDKTIDEGAETIFTLYAQLAETEMRNKASRFARARKELYGKGRYMGGKITRGYKLSEDGYWIVDEDDSYGHMGAPFIRTVFDLYNTGDYSMTELGLELQSRGYFSGLKITNVKAEISHMLKNPIYLGIRTNNNIYPQIIDQESWDRCAKWREEKRCKPEKKNQYLLTPLIHCSCGASYMVNVHDGTYSCRVKHNAVEKGLEHTPDIHASLMESLAWYVALQELHEDMINKRADARELYKQDLEILQAKAQKSDEQIKTLISRRSKLDEDFYVLGRFTEEQYEAMTEKQNEAIKKEQENLRRTKKSISDLESQIEAAVTFDEMIDSLHDSFDTLKDGTEFMTMRNIVRRYILDINILPLEGKKTSWWKRVIFKTAHGEQNKIKAQELREQGLEDAAVVLGNEFIVDSYHHKVYWDRELKYEVPYVFMDRVPRQRKDNRKGRKRNKTQQKQY